ncbi:TlpA family protein disulfide reductase [Bradyrhizobium hipponense]|uniref:TlpA family protein disulfide reductase n=1 Tax=Bradyrhizobium hipponense TaxID=2605638 RepID=A0A5S4YHX5_9BRAD|nr:MULTISPECIES: TlpA disulfide reductase family protein [Bradyrhizobium]MDE5446535.1 redoxin family protein [Bradyrhizobium sp. CSA207]TYO63643.1 TlpA family protein disulfide reductase [Bradyrhizobium hipponense]
MALCIKSPAPSLKVENWLRGEPLTNFQSGKVYIVEFWASWCGPCVEAMPHLIELQAKYKDEGVEVVGVAANEKAPTADEARTKLDAWLTEKFSNLNYRIGFDSTGEMNKLWMDASSSLTIPTSFVVDRDGHIAFIDNAIQIDDVLPKIINGTWRSSDQAKAAEAKRIAENQRVAREDSIRRTIRSAIKAKDWPAALSAVEESIATMPDNLEFREIHADLLLHKMRDTATGFQVLRQLVRDAIDKHSEAVWGLNIVMRQLFDPDHDRAYLPRAERFAIGRDVSEHILNPGQANGLDFYSYGVVAQYYYESGDKQRAIELIERAMTWLDDPKVPDGAKEHYMPKLLQTLATYRGEKVCCSGSCSISQEKSPGAPKVQPQEET